MSASSTENLTTKRTPTLTSNTASCSSTPTSLTSPQYTDIAFKLIREATTVVYSSFNETSVGVKWDLSLIPYLLPEIDQVVRSKLKEAMEKEKETLCNSPTTKYPALFFIKGGGKVHNCFLEVYSSQFILFGKVEARTEVSRGRYKVIQKVVPIRYRGTPMILARAVNTYVKKAFGEKSTTEEGYYGMFARTPNFVRTLECFEYATDHKIILMRYYQDTLSEAVFFMHQQECLRYPNDVIFQLDIAIKLMKAIAYMHEKNVLHRDIKLENVLCNGRDIGLADFGFCCDANDKESLSDVAGSFMYCSYELFSGLFRNCGKVENSKASDVWSAACVLWLWFYNAPYPWYENLRNLEKMNKKLKVAVHLKRDKSILLELFQLVGDVESRMLKTIEDLHNPNHTRSGDPKLRILMKMLRLNPLERPSAQNIVEELTVYRQSLTSSIPKVIDGNLN